MWLNEWSFTNNIVVFDLYKDEVGYVKSETIE